MLVIGSGPNGLAAAIRLAEAGRSVLVLEAADVPGGIMRISSGEYWIPNNSFMREQGIEDPRDRCLQLMARLSYPTMYDPESPTLGVPARAYRLFQAYYDTASPAVEDLAEIGAMPSALSDGVTPDAVFNPLETPEQRLILYTPVPEADTAAKLVKLLEDEPFRSPLALAR